MYKCFSSFCHNTYIIIAGVFGNFENYLSIYKDANIHVLGMNVDLKYSQTSLSRTRWDCLK